MPDDHDDITFRPATLDDIATLAGLRWEMQLEHHPETPLPNGARTAYLSAYSLEMRGEMERGRMRAWIAEADGQPIATVTLLWWVVPPAIDGPRRLRGQISNVFTYPAYRRRGISRQLMTLLIADAREQGITRLILWPSEMAEPLYRGLGFTGSQGMELNL